MIRNIAPIAISLLTVSSAQAHDLHADCRVGPSWMGRVAHYHPGMSGRAVRCDLRAAPGTGAAGVGQPPAPPPPSGDYRYPDGTVLGRGEAAGCGPTQARVVEGGASVCRDAP